MEEKEKEGKEGRRKGKVRDMGTLENLVSAFIGESMARNRYTFYASIAKEEGFVFISKVFLETAENEKSVEESGKEKEIDSLKVEVSALSFSTRTMNVLEKSKIKTIGDLVNMNEDEIINLEGMGEKGLKEIKKAIGDFGLTLKQKQVSKARNK